MLIYKENKLGKLMAIKYALTYFDMPYEKPNVDIIREWQYAKQRLFSEKFYTLFIDLTKDEDAIFSEFEKNTKYEINRAQAKDNITILTLDEKKEKGAFYEFYNAFAASKNLPPIGEKEADLLIENNMFKIRAAFCNEQALVYHSYVVTNQRARLMQSVSLFRDSTDNAFRNLTGRANRLLHWDDMRYFKRNGFLLYDFGGISIDKNNPETMAINKFKECFGGTPAMEYKSQIPVNPKGFMFLLGKKILGKI